MIKRFKKTEKDEQVEGFKPSPALLGAKATKQMASWVFTAGVTVSIAANFISAATHGSELGPVISGLVAVLWPLGMVGAKILLTRVMQLPGKRWPLLILGGLIFAAGFAGSAIHLWSLAHRAGNGSEISMTMPVLIDLLMIFAAAVAVASAGNVETLKAEEIKAAKQRTVEAKAAAEAEAAKQAAQAKAKATRDANKAARTRKARAGEKVSSEALVRFMDENPDVTTKKAIAEHFGVTPKTIGRYLADLGGPVTNGAAA